MYSFEFTTGCTKHSHPFDGRLPAFEAPVQSWSEENVRKASLQQSF
nr:hypothetical protein [Bacteroides pyogenes]